jgi:hypothetical protein
MSPGLQEAVALAVVAAVVGVALWRRWRRRKATPGCDGCGQPSATPKEAPLRFHRRRPS